MLKRLISTVFIFGSAVPLFAHGISEHQQEAMINGGLPEFVRLGAVHMLTGYDHLLFLLGVIFFLNNAKDILKFVTVFTLGHSITLIFATVFNVSANYFLIDAVIALSVCYKGFENLGGFQKILKRNGPNLLFIVFVFGLIHGFGLSTRLQLLPLSDHGLIARILSFNLGVELGQILALFVMIVVISFWRQFPSFKRFSVASNILLIAAGIVLFVFQITGFIRSGYAEEPETPIEMELHYEHSHGGEPHHH